MAQMSKAGDLTSGPMLKKIILFSLPLAASSFLQLLFNAADVVVVGRFQRCAHQPAGQPVCRPCAGCKRCGCPLLWRKG